MSLPLIFSSIRARHLFPIVAYCLLLWPMSPARAADEYDAAPILYSDSQPNDPVTALQNRLDDGEAALEFDKRHGYLKSLLAILDVPISSQMLVFSKTSLQIRHIEPRSPRAIYFNDDVYIGWVQGGDVLEISAVDPRLGAVFYTLEQTEVEAPKFQRATHRCLQCHATRRTQDVPGHVVRSLFTAYDGRPLFNAGSYNTDHTSPLAERWGGWYVTGEHGEQRHMGNVFVMDRQKPQELNRDAGANITKLEDRFDTSRYLSAHSDIVAMMVMAHQAQMHNYITAANFQTRQALHSNAVMNRALERAEDYRSDSTERRIHKVAERLLKYLLFVEMAHLEQPVRGSTNFAKEFTARGPADSQGRSLRDFDLKRQLFRYPCGFLVYSQAFEQLPPAVKSLVYRRLWEVLTGRDESDEFAHLSPSDRKAIFEILCETKTDLPEYWKSSAEENPAP